MITTFVQAKLLNQLVNHYWFTPGAMRFLGTKLGVIHAAPYGAYFSFTNHGPDGQPQQKVAYINDAGYVNPSYAGDGAGHLSREEWEGLMDTEYESSRAAADAAREKARTAWARH